jgi:predicted DNA-binding protein
METQIIRTTVYLEPELHKDLRLMSATVSRSLSDLVNEAIRESLLEDAEDLADFEERIRDPLVSYEEIVKRLQQNGRL